VNVAADWLAIGVWADEPYAGAAASLVTKLRDAGDFSAKHLELLPILNPPGITAERLIFVGLGKRADAKRSTLHDAAATVARHVTGKQVGSLAFVVPAPEWTLAVGVGLAHGSQGPGIRKTTPTRFAPGLLMLVGGDGAALPRVRAESHALWLARELVNLPPSELYPETFAATAADSGRLNGFDVEVWDAPGSGAHGFASGCGEGFHSPGTTGDSPLHRQPRWSCARAGGEGCHLR
jgi:leucyl aminopeptidase